MNFKFLHAADLHLGSPLTGLSLKDEDIARRFAAASRVAFSALVDAAIENGVSFVLIAGDIYDGDWKDTGIGLFFNREISRLVRAGIPAYFIRGNHDAESEIRKAVPLPDGVIEFPSRKAHTERIETLKTAIHGRSFADRAVTENLALTYPPAVPGWLNIGMLHTSCEGHAAHAVYAPCSVQDLAMRGYDYWALGHVHDHAVLHEYPWIVYSGNLQGRSVRECGPKGAVLVDVADGRIAAVRPITLDQARWLTVSVDLGGETNESALEDRIRDAVREPLRNAAGRLTAIRVTLSGETPLHGVLQARHAALRTNTQALINHVHDDAWLESLKIATSPPPARAHSPSALDGIDPEALLAGLEADASVREAAEALIALVKSKLPSGIGSAGLDDLDAILADARALATARALEGAGS